MLKEIYCKNFVENGKTRKPIIFHNGLNVVIGQGNANGKSENSIGKSTFLQIIDFCFGGNSYLKSKCTEIIKNQLICFKFEFEKAYYFLRSTKTEDDIYTCDENYQNAEKIPIADFKKFLSQKYGTLEIDNNFHSIVNLYFRIYNKSEQDAKKILQEYSGQSGKEQIRKLERLFDDFKEIKVLTDIVDPYDDKQNILSNEKRKKVFLKELEQKETREELQQQIAEYERQREELFSKRKDSSIDLDSENAKNIATLKSDLKRLRATRSRLLTRLENISEKEAKENFGDKTAYDSLLEFFPNANIKLLNEIQDFHKRFTESLNKDFKEAEKELNAEIESIESQIKQKESELLEIEDAEDFSIAFLNSYSDIQNKIADCNKKITELENESNYQKQVKKSKNELKEKEGKLLELIAQKINVELFEFCEIVFGENYNPVKIDFPTNASISIDVKTDEGTGTNYSGEILFDIAMLKLTKLPAIIHDSFWLSNIRGTRPEAIFKLYSSFNSKQIFISIDEIEKYTDDAQNLLTANKVINLYPNGGELFGTSFAKTDKL